MGKETIYMSSIDKMMKHLGLSDMRHPRVEVLDFGAILNIHGMQGWRITSSFYKVLFKETLCANLKYGQGMYDYSMGTMLFIAPGQVLEIEDILEDSPKGWGLLFHPELLRGQATEEKMKGCHFFEYNSSEALHVSEQERYMLFSLKDNLVN